MKNVYVREVLTPTDLQYIKDRYFGLLWEDGGTTSTSKNKINKQAIVGPEFLEIDKLIVDRFFEDEELYYMTLSTKVSRTILSKMVEGGRYGIHTDHHSLGHYSTTTFLSEPSEYEGGELCLKIDGEVRKYKLPAGHAVTYLTGIPHCVEPVTKGTRLVGINWTTSKYSDITDRDLASDIERIYDMTGDDDVVQYSFEQESNSLGYIVSELRSKYMRRYS